ncbi:aspartic peptidase domain-containing protein [Mycena vitilis]|nr:aspartic peptidase domain-containing protein [Mycena vitilis]
MHMLPLSSSLLAFIFFPLDLWPVCASPSRLARYTVGSSTSNNIINKNDVRYTVNITVAGTSVNVFLDTGSTDMWVQPPGGISGSFTNTGAIANLSYGDGSNTLKGTVGLGIVEIAGFTIPQQAFLNITDLGVAEESDEAESIFGLVGLGFDNPSDHIPSALTRAGMNGKDAGKSVLSSIFDQNPTKAQFFSFSLSRAFDIGDTADASLVISGFDENYAAVQSAPIIPQFPVNSGEWSVLTEGIFLGGSPIHWTSHDTSLPAGQTAVLLDTGTPNILLPAEIRDAIYSAVPGAVLARNSAIPTGRFSEDNDVWVVPCGMALNMTTKFAGQEFPIHPLDITDIHFTPAPDGNTYTICTGSITNGGIILEGPGRDALYGDSFLRNVYSVFSFGNDTTPPHVQFLADTIADTAATDFANARAKTLLAGPPELDPQDIINLFDGSSSGSSSVAAGSDAVSAQVSGNLAGGNNSSSTADSTVAKYGPLVIGLLAANLGILLIVAFLGIMAFVRNGRSTGPTYRPVRFKENAPSTMGHTAYSD